MNGLRKCLYKMDFNSATKNEILSFAGKWMKWENIILSEVSQSQKAKDHMFFHHIWNIIQVQIQTIL
jgi:hypothetical protein